MSTVALAIGLVVGNLIHPGAGLHLTTRRRGGRQQAARRGHGSTTDFLLGIIPTSLVSSLTGGEVLQTLLVALLVGFALQAMGAAGEPVLRAVGTCQRLVFRVLAMIMWAAPIGAFGAIAAVVGATGVDALKSLAVIMSASTSPARSSSSSSWARCSGWSPGVNIFRCCATWAASSC